MPGRNKNFPGEDTDQLNEISICPETMTVAHRPAVSPSRSFGAHCSPHTQVYAVDIIEVATNRHGCLPHCYRDCSADLDSDSEGRAGGLGDRPCGRWGFRGFGRDGWSQTLHSWPGFLSALCSEGQRWLRLNTAYLSSGGGGRACWKAWGQESVAQSSHQQCQ